MATGDGAAHQPREASERDASGSGQQQQPRRRSACTRGTCCHFPLPSRRRPRRRRPLALRQELQFPGTPFPASLRSLDLFPCLFSLLQSQGGRHWQPDSRDHMPSLFLLALSFRRCTRTSQHTRGEREQAKSETQMTARVVPLSPPSPFLLLTLFLCQTACLSPSCSVAAASLEGEETENRIQRQRNGPRLSLSLVQRHAARQAGRQEHVASQSQGERRTLAAVSSEQGRKGGKHGSQLMGTRKHASLSLSLLRSLLRASLSL